jgi:hypothetical protein
MQAIIVVKVSAELSAAYSDCLPWKLPVCAYFAAVMSQIRSVRVYERLPCPLPLGALVHYMHTVLEWTTWGSGFRTGDIRLQRTLVPQT